MGGRVLVVNDVREEAALVATVRLLGWRQLDSFNPTGQLFAHVYRP